MEITLYCCFLSLFLIQQHQAYPSSKPGPTTEEGLPTQLVHKAHRREKRCSCENPRDKECVYFCHVGILWINTPSQVVSYGSVRLRRDLDRCLCTDHHDDGCLRYCSANRKRSDWKTSEVKKQTSKQQNRRKALWERNNRTGIARPKEERREGETPVAQRAT
ncbi:endothelin-1 [Gadus macrocephalus]|uniref:endothelin-1 n=1 Tax=Gadus macrocephalus TaxID=80720 RepID=UPI0028CBBA44|nr:endothelin-1 [Gadus macrocephalus]